MTSDRITARLTQIRTRPAPTMQDARWLLEELEELLQQKADLEEALEQARADHDGAREAADQLAYAIAPAEIIGEHTAENDPWQNAYEIATDSARPRAPKPALGRLIQSGDTYTRPAAMGVFSSRHRNWLVIKAARDRDLYIGWSNVTDSPAWAGTRSEALAAGVPAGRLNLADTNGSTSRIDNEGHWDHPGFIAEQRWLPRAHLGDYALRWLQGDMGAAFDLLEPLDGETEAMAAHDAPDPVDPTLAVDAARHPEHITEEGGGRG